jgi:hypothetical protein
MISEAMGLLVVMLLLLLEMGSMSEAHPRSLTPESCVGSKAEAAARIQATS